MASGLPVANDKALAGEEPDQDAADQAGAGRAAIASTSPMPTPASSSTLPISPGRISTCARAAISGTTPPNGWVPSFCPWRNHRLRQNSAVAGDQRNRAVVAGGFKAEDQRHRRGHCPMAARFTRGRRWIAPDRPLRLGTRGSPLALAQARAAAAALLTANGWDDGAVEIVSMVTTGDRVKDRPLAELGGKMLWTKELDRALLAGDVDACGPFDEGCRERAARPSSVRRRACSPRADVRDRLIGAESPRRPAAWAPTIGTSSPRRAAQLRRAPPRCFAIEPFRGNVRDPARRSSPRARFPKRPCSPPLGSTGSASRPGTRLRPS